MKPDSRKVQWIAMLGFLAPYGPPGMCLAFLEPSDPDWHPLEALGSPYAMVVLFSIGVHVLVTATVLRGLLFAKWGIWRPQWAFLAGATSFCFGLMISSHSGNVFAGVLAAVMVATLFPGAQAVPRETPATQLRARETSRDEQQHERVSLHMPNPWHKAP